MGVNVLSTEKMNTMQEQHGSVSFANDVVATIAGLATIEIEGVAGYERRFFRKTCRASRGVKT